MASLLKRNGVYYAEFYDASEKPAAKRFSLKTRSKAEARQSLTDLERDWQSGAFDPWRDSPDSYNIPSKSIEAIGLADALSAFLRDKTECGRSKATIQNYSAFCGQLVQRVGPRKPLRALTPDDITDFVREAGLAPASRRTRLRHVRAWLRWCEKKGYISESPTKDVAPPPKGEKIPKAVRRADLEAIEEAIRADYRDKRDKRQVQEGEMLWLIPLFGFGLYSGLRSSELARLRWKHVDLDRELIYIYKQKNGLQQTVPLTAPARRILESLEPSEPDAFVFLAPNSNPYERSTDCFKSNAARKFKRYKKAAGIERRITPHGLRHGFCTILAEAGKSAPVIKEAARHSDIATSMRYVHIANEHLKSELDDVFS